MNFSSHVNNLRKRLRLCLTLNKYEMLTELRECLIQAKSLLKTEEFNFYITQFEVVEIENFATTKYAVESVQIFLDRKDLNITDSRRDLIYEISMTSENLLTYTDDDSCSMQSQYHWYYCIDGGFVYKLSELGESAIPSGKKITGTLRVAKISELPSEFHINLI